MTVETSKAFVLIMPVNFSVMRNIITLYEQKWICLSKALREAKSLSVGHRIGISKLSISITIIYIYF